MKAAKIIPSDEGEKLLDDFSNAEARLRAMLQTVKRAHSRFLISAAATYSQADIQAALGQPQQAQSA
jgi:hypothetical protein